MASEAQTTSTKENVRDIARGLYNGGMRCNCDLDCWKPEASTGHSRVCRIHRAALLKYASASD